MNKVDRWLFTIAINLCAVPIVALGIVYQLLPQQIPIINIITQTTETTSKTNDLIICLFVLIPLTMAVGAAFLKYKKLIDRNFKFVTAASMLLSVVFSAVLIYCLKIQTEGIQLLRSIDYSTVVCCLLSLCLSFIGTLLYGLKPNDIVGFRNRFTSKSEEVWVGAHRIMSYTANGLFTLTAIVLSFFRGWYVVTAVLLALAIFVFGLVQLISYRYYKYIDKRNIKMTLTEV